MMRLALRTLRFRKGGFIATFVAVVFGTAIVMACGGLMETGIRSNVPPERLAAAPIVVTGKQSHLRPGAEDATPLTEQVGVPTSLVAKIRSLDGVTDAVGDLSFPAPHLKGASDGLGHSWSSAGLAPYQLQSGTPPSRAGEVVLDVTTAWQSGARVGSRIQLLVQGKQTSFVVKGIAAGPAGHTFFSMDEATRLADRPGRFAAIGVLVAPGTDLSELQDRIESAAGGTVTTQAGVDRGLAEHPDAGTGSAALIAIAGSFGGIATMTMMFVVASTLALSAQHRAREIALLRSIGTTPGQVRRMILGEAMAVSLPAVLIGCVPGVLLGQFLFDQLAANGVASSAVTYRQGWIPFAAGAGAAVLAAVGAALIAGRKSAKIQPVEALLEAGLQRKWFSWVRLLFGLVFLGGGLALVIVTFAVMSGPLAGATAGPAVLCWAIGIALLGPFWTNAVLALIRWPLYAVSRVNGRLAILNVTARSVAMSAAVMPVMLATGIATANLYMQTTQVNAAEEAFTRDLRADAVLVSSSGLAPALLPQVQSLPGVASASAYVTSMGVIDEPRNAPFDEDGAPLQGVSAQDGDGAAPVRLISGSLSGLTGATVALPDHVAAKIDRPVGSQITMTLGDGAAVDLRVVATFAAERGYESIVLPAELVAAHTTDQMVKQILVRAEPGADVGPSLARLAAAHPGVQVADRDALVAGHTEDLKTQAWVNYLLVGMLIAYTAVSVVNTLVSATVRRRREFGLQRLTGSTRGQVLRMLTTEAFLVSVAGILLGTLVAAATLIPFSATVSDSPMPAGPLWIYLIIIGAAAVLTFASILTPATTTLRSRPAEAAARTD